MPVTGPSVNRRKFLHTAAGAAVAGGILAAGGLTENAAAQTAREQDSGVWYRAKVLTQLCDQTRAIDIEADQFTFCAAGGGKNPGIVPDVTKAYFDRLTNQMIDLMRLRGISVTNLQKVTFSQTLPEGGQVLSTLNEDALRESFVKGVVSIWVCYVYSDELGSLVLWQRVFIFPIANLI